MEHAVFITKLIEVFKDDLPGFDSQVKLAPKSKVILNDHAEINNPKRSAVLILLYPQNGSVYVPFIKRVTDGSMHSGQIAFPGGKYENADKNLRNTAKRETEEEVGIINEDVKILKELTPLYIPVSNYIVQPVVGIIDYKPNFILNSEEVDKIFEVNISELSESYIVCKDFTVRDTKITAPFIILDEIEIWGATAMILSEFIDITKKID